MATMRLLSVDNGGLVDGLCLGGCFEGLSIKRRTAWTIQVLVCTKNVCLPLYFT